MEHIPSTMGNQTLRTTDRKNLMFSKWKNLQAFHFSLYECALLDADLHQLYDKRIDTIIRARTILLTRQENLKPLERGGQYEKGSSVTLLL